MADDATLGSVIGSGFVLWTLGLLVLTLIGLVLSGAALRASRRLSEQRAADATAMTTTLRTIYRFVLWLCCLYYYLSLPLVLVAVLGVGGGLIYVFFLVGQIPVKLVLLIAVFTFVTASVIVKSLFVRGTDEDPGLRLDEDRAPRLSAVLREVAAKVGTRPVDSVFITPGTQIAVFERGGVGRQLRGTTERCLILGVAVLGGLRVLEFKAILAHEYGHFSNRDTAGGGFAIAVRRSLTNMAIGLARGGAARWYNPAWLFFVGFHKIFLRISQGASRLQEVLADRMAAFAYGSEAFVSGLKRVIRRSVRFDAHVESVLTEVVEHDVALPNLYAYRPKDGLSKRDLKDRVSEALDAEPSPYDSHPSPRDRIAWVRALDVSGPDDGDDSDVWTLFDDREGLERDMTARVRDNVYDAHGVTIRADPGPAG